MLKGMLKRQNKIEIYQVAQKAGWKTPNTLIWREPAQKMRPEFVKRLYKENETVCELDFSGIETADGSFIDEFLVTELKSMDAGKVSKKAIYLSNLNDVVLYNVELVFTKKRPAGEKFYMMFRKADGTWELFSEGIEASLKETLEYIMIKKELTSNDVSKKFNISVPAASVRLKNLFDMRIVDRKDETTSTGKEFVYESLF